MNSPRAVFRSETAGDERRITNMRRTLFLLLFGAASAFSQPFSFGVKAGVPLTDFVDAAQSIHSNGFLRYATHTNRYILGATGELRFPFGLGIELDVLYRHLNYQSSTQIVGITTTTADATTTGNAWEFPLLAKYRFPTKVVRPYLVGGVAWDTLQGLRQSVKNTVLGGPPPSTVTTSVPAELQNKTTRGYVAGAGLDIRILVIHILPEVRFTRWGAKHFFDTNDLLNSNRNQAEFLLGISF